MTSCSDSEHSLASEEDDFYIVEEILGHEYDDDGHIVFVVKWLGYSEDDCTCEPVENFEPGNEVLEKYCAEQNLLAVCRAKALQPIEPTQSVPVLSGTFGKRKSGFF